MDRFVKEYSFMDRIRLQTRAALMRAEEYTVILLYFFCLFHSFRRSYVSLVSYSPSFFLLYFLGVGRGRRLMVWGGMWGAAGVLGRRSREVTGGNTGSWDTARGRIYI